MQGANDNYSGDAAILDAARTLRTLIADGRLPRPKRTIRFLWAPEISGTGSWVKANPDIMRRTLCNINLDMVGVDLQKSLAFFCFMRTTYGNPHYVNDVLENVFRYVGETNRSYVTNGMTGQLNKRIVAPSGSEQPMPWYAGTHFGSSDHEVFNDWGVGVPGVVLNTWPDQWYHTSEDRPDKLDATQMKRAVAITAAAAYIIASADDGMAGQIAAEIVSNAAGRIGHQLARGVEEMKRAATETLPAVYKKVRAYIEAAGINERATLDIGPAARRGQGRLRRVPGRPESGRDRDRTGGAQDRRQRDAPGRPPGGDPGGRPQAHRPREEGRGDRAQADGEDQGGAGTRATRPSSRKPRAR